MAYSPTLRHLQISGDVFTSALMNSIRITEATGDIVTLSIGGSTTPHLSLTGDTAGAVALFRQSGGTVASPTATQSGNIIANVQIRGYVDGAYAGNSGYIFGVANQNWTTGARGTRWEIGVNADGATVPFTVATFSGTGLAVTGTLSTTDAVAFSCAKDSAIRQTGTTGGVLYFDVASGGATAGYFQWRSSNAYTTYAMLNSGGLAVTGQGTFTNSANSAGQVAVLLQNANGSSGIGSRLSWRLDNLANEWGYINVNRVGAGATAQMDFAVNGSAYAGAATVIASLTTTGLAVTGTVTITGGSYDALTISGSSSNAMGLRIFNSYAGSRNWIISASGGGPSTNGTLAFWDDTAGALRMSLSTGGLDVAGVIVASGTISAISTNPRIEWYDNGGAADAKRWDFLASAGVGSFRLVNDANSAANTWLQVNRTGYASATIAMTGGFTATAPNTGAHDLNATSGARLQLFGGSHASLPNQAYLDANSIFIRTSGGTSIAGFSSGTFTVEGSIRSQNYTGSANLGLLLFGNTTNNYIYFNGTNVYHRVGGNDTLTVLSGGISIGTYDGEVTTGTSDGVYAYSVGVVRSSRNGNSALDLRRRSSDGTIAQFYRDTTLVGTISVTTTATAYNTTSDARLKTNVRDYDSGSILDLLRPRIFDWKSGHKDSIGFIAQELYAVYPQAVTKGDDGDEITREWGVDFSKLVPVLVAELKILRARVKELESSK